MAVNSSAATLTNVTVTNNHADNDTNSAGDGVRFNVLTDPWIPLDIGGQARLASYAELLTGDADAAELLHPRDDFRIFGRMLLSALTQARPNVEFGPMQSVVHGARCEGTPVCAMVVAVYEAATWTVDMRGY